MPEPELHWCDRFRDLERLALPDPRYASRSVVDPNRGMRPMTLEDHWHDVAGIELHNGVPEPIRVHFDTARNLLLHSWFVYRFNPVAEMHAFSSVEYALNRRLGTPLRDKSPGFKRLLNMAVERGWIRADGFRHFREIAAEAAALPLEEAEATYELSQYLETLVGRLPFLRNELAHGSGRLAPSGKRTLALCCDLINQIFALPLAAS